jgi:hypothetical protein
MRWLISFAAKPIIEQSQDETRGNPPVNIFVVACIAAAVIALGAVVVLNSIQEPVAVAYSTNAVRI